MESESQDDAHKHLSHTEDEEKVLNAFNFPAESVERNGSGDVSTSHNAGHQEELGMAFARAALLFSLSVLIIDPKEKDLKVEETECGDVVSNALFDMQELSSGTNHKHIHPVEDAEQLNTGTITTESYLQHQIDHSQDLDTKPNSHANHDNQPEDVVSSLFAGDSGLKNSGRSWRRK